MRSLVYRLYNNNNLVLILFFAFITYIDFISKREKLKTHK